MLEISPVNFIFGKNSSGKTTVLRSLLFFKQFVTETTLSGEVPFAGPHADFGSYAEAVLNGVKSRDITFSVVVPFDNRRFGSARLRRELPDMSSVRMIEACAKLHWNARRGRAQFNSIEFRDVTGLVHRSLIQLTRTAPNKFKVAIPELSWSALIESESELNFSSLSLGYGLTRTSKIEQEVSPEAEIYGFELFRTLRQALFRVEHVGPLRDMPERAYRLADLAIPSGSTQHVLGLLEKSDNAIKDISNAMNDLKIARQIHLARLAPGYAGIVIKDIRTGRNDNLADVGFGVSQVLPIIARVATSRPGSLILIEQPELHLHPETQGRLVDVLLDLSLKKNVSIFIESHSEAMLLRLRRRIAENSVRSQDVKVYVTNTGSVRPAALGSDGSLDMSVFPDDFFEENWIDSIAMARAAAADK